MARSDARTAGRLGALDKGWLEALIGVALAAGKEALEPRPPEPRRRPAPPSAASPADRARRLVLDALAEMAPHTAVLAAGDPLFHDGPADPAADLFLVSALEGDAEGRDATISIALARGGEPALGVVYAPGRGRLWAGGPDGALGLEASPRGGAGPGRPIQVRAASRGEAADEAEPAIALCLVAEGRADVARLAAGAPAWGVAAADAVLRAAGGRTSGADGGPLRYPFPSGEILTGGGIVGLGSEEPAAPIHA